MNLYALSALVILFLFIVAFGMRVLLGLSTNTTPASYNVLLVLLFIILIAGTVWQLFQSHIL
jgi:hypothetical protein